MAKFADFGSEAEHYAAGRRGYPDTVFYYLKTFIQEKDPILDLGCGTGIATRQLARHDFEDVQGADQDERMLEEARENPQYKHILYFQAKAEELPFVRGQFKAITCFSSFHWFTNDKAIAEIKRVLKRNGVLFIVNKKDNPSLKGEIEAKVEAELNVKFPKVITTDEEVSVLKDHFELQPVRKFPGEDLYTLNEAVEYINSTSFWAAIPEDRRKNILDKIVIPTLQGYLKWERIARNYDAVCLAAIKKGI